MIVPRLAEEAVVSGGAEAPLEIVISENSDDQRMIMSILSDTLYPDKIAAVLREYACNGADANVEADRGETPIQVTLPTRLAPVVTIRDSGVGMSRDDVVNTFCKLGGSTKRRSNAVTGMLGIGSKAGYAYGDCFMVSCFSNGTLTIYNCFRENGRLSMSALSEAPTTEPDGVEIKVPVKQEDIQRFVATAERIYKYFKVPPEIKGAQINLQRTGPQFTGTGWRYTGDGVSVAIMGNVGYTITPESTGLTDVAMLELLRLGIELDYPIGTLEVAANREELQYRKITTDALRETLKTVIAEIAKVFSDQITGAKCKWEALCMYHNLFEKLGGRDMRNLRTLVDTAVEWGGQKIKSTNLNFSGAKDSGVIVSHYNLDRWYRNRVRAVHHYEGNCSAHVTDVMGLVENDLKNKAHSPNRLRGFFNQYAGKTEVMIVSFSDDKAKDAYIKEKGLGGAPWVMFSTVVPISTAIGVTGIRTYQPSAHQKKHSSKVFEIDLTVNGRKDAKSEHWKVVDVDLDDGGVYVAIDQFCFRHPRDSWTHPCVLRDFILRLHEIKEIGLPTIHGFKQPILADLLKKHPKWVEMSAWLKIRMAGLSKSKKFVAAWNDRMFYDTHKMLIDEDLVRSELQFRRGGAMQKYLLALRCMSRQKMNQLFGQEIQPELP